MTKLTDSINLAMLRKRGYADLPLAIAIAGMLNRALSQGSSGRFGEWAISTLLPIVRDTRSSTVRRATAALAISMALLCGSVCGFWGGFILLFMFSKG